MSKGHTMAHVTPEMQRAFYDGLAATIDLYGHTVMGIMGDGETPSFAYTVGLAPKHGVELLVVGLGAGLAQHLLNQIAHECLGAGQILTLDVPDTRWTTLPVVFKVCDDRAREWATQAFRFYPNSSPKIIQMVLCDRNGLFPWDANFDHVLMSFQPLLYPAANN